LVAGEVQCQGVVSQWEGCCYRNAHGSHLLVLIL
jgi:hypothetical protein